MSEIVLTVFLALMVGSWLAAVVTGVLVDG